MDNNNRNTPHSGLTPENLKWLEEMMESNTKPIETIPEPEQKPAVEPTPEKTAEELEIDNILATDWDNISLPEAPAEKIAPVQEEPETEAVAQEPEQPAKGRRNIPKKGRPKKKDGYGLLGIPHILATFIWLALILAIGVSLGRVLWVCCADVMAFGKDDQKVTITITAEDTIDTISQKLGQANLVRYPNLFKMFAELTGKDEDICVGTFTLSPQLDYNAMINAMYSSTSKRGVVDVMFPEGYNCAQIFKTLEAEGVCTAAELEEYAANGELKEYWFLEGVPRGSKYCLEGYLAPDTYSFYLNDSPRRVLEKLLNEFDDRFTDKMKADFQTMQATFAARLRSKGFGAAYVQEHTLTLHQVVTLASVVQKEAASVNEGFDIASVFYNRLSNPNILSLGADATVYYAIGDYFGEIDELTAEHLNVDSPYNTRKNQGIPPGPICNMGVQALYAALEPNDTDYNYFVYDRSESAHRFAVTESEHNKNVAELMG